jgi:RNA-directed DNA polymerase
LPGNNIKDFFDTIDHDLLMREVEKQVHESWQGLYIKRWLQVPVQHKDGIGKIGPGNQRYFWI